MVNTLIAITNENGGELHMMVGVPLSPSDGKIPTYEYGNGIR
jgi:hypothetical protein